MKIAIPGIVLLLSVGTVQAHGIEVEHVELLTNKTLELHNSQHKQIQELNDAVNVSMDVINKAMVNLHNMQAVLILETQLSHFRKHEKGLCLTNDEFNEIMIDMENVQSKSGVDENKIDALQKVYKMLTNICTE